MYVCMYKMKYTVKAQAFVVLIKHILAEIYTDLMDPPA